MLLLIKRKAFRQNNFKYLIVSYIDDTIHKYFIILDLNKNSILTVFHLIWFLNKAFIIHM